MKAVTRSVHCPSEKRKGSNQLQHFIVSRMMAHMQTQAGGFFLTTMFRGNAMGMRAILFSTIDERA